MKTTLAATLALLLWCGTAQAGLLDVLGLGRKSTNQVTGVASLPQDQVVLALKEALDKGVQQAVAQLGRSNGFLTNLNVRIPMPEQLRAMEKTLRSLRQDRLADEFVSTMNHAAEQAVPEAAGVFADAVRKMTFEDARSILAGTTNAATQYFRRATETNLHARFLPIVQEATARTGVTAAYKRLTERASTTALGSLGRSLFGSDLVDVDAYVTTKALDGLFVMVAAEEQRIRENPAARTSALLQQVFGAVARQSR